MPVQSKKDIEVCVIGAGVCGLVSIKACLEAGLKVTCYERSPHFGGLWKYQDEKHAKTDTAIPSVMRTTILNTSKELSAFSDFPPAGHLPNFMRHSLYMDYINSYVNNFQLASHIKLDHEIINCEPKLDPQTRDVYWSVDVHDIKNDMVFNRSFDRLMIAVGHHNIPHVPTFPNQHKFKGLVIHSVAIKDILNDPRFVDRRVAVVGLGNSACDAANDLALVTERCYVSCHRGSWFVGRLSPNGPYDFEVKNRWSFYKSKLLPKWYTDRKVIGVLDSKINHKLLGLTPKHKPSEQQAAINDLFAFRVFTGGATLKGAIHKFTKNGLIFEGEEDNEYEVDVVVLATGYEVKVPFMKEYELGIKSAETKEYELYLNMFAPRLTVNDFDVDPMKLIKTLVFIGSVQPNGSILVVADLQARLAALVFKDERQLPNFREMLKHNQRVKNLRSKAVRSHSKDQLIGPWIGYLDLLASKVGVKPDLTKLFFTDFQLWNKLMFGPSVSYQYRLSGSGKWDKARETIMTVNQRVYNGINDGKNHVLFQSRRKCLKMGLAKSQK